MLDASPILLLRILLAEQKVYKVELNFVQSTAQYVAIALEDNELESIRCSILHARYFSIYNIK
jgi:hypothetical protein